jgi:rubrerythrin
MAILCDVFDILDNIYEDELFMEIDHILQLEEDDDDDDEHQPQPQLQPEVIHLVNDEDDDEEHQFEYQPQHQPEVINLVDDEEDDEEDQVEVQPQPQPQYGVINLVDDEEDEDQVEVQPQPEQEEENEVIMMEAEIMIPENLYPQPANSQLRVYTTLVESREYQKMMEEPCAICLESYTHGTMVSMECHHCFCQKCLFLFLQHHEENKCPLCRTNSSYVRNYVLQQWK